MADVTQTQDLSQERLLTGVRRQTVGSTTYPVLGETVLVAKVGEGAVGAVYEGRIPGDERPVAVRVMRCVNEQSERYTQFLAHSRAAQNVKSHHLVDIKETGAEPGLFYQVMEFTPSVSAHAHLSALRDKLKPGLSEADALELAQSLANGLAALHAANVPHLNISPSAILIPKDSGGTLDFTRCKLGDQGLAFHEHFARVLEGTAADHGTPGYMSPEQAQGSKNPGKTSDVFAFGASLYAMLAGHAPFDGPSVPVILSVTCLQEVSDLRTWRPDVSRITSRLVELCLRKGPSMRFPDASVLQRAVRLCRDAHQAPANIQDAAMEEMQALIRQDEVKEQLLSRFFPPPPPDASATTEEPLPPATPATTHISPSPIPPEVSPAVPMPVTPLSALSPAVPDRPLPPVEEPPPAVPATEPAYSAAIEVPPPPEWTEAKTTPPASHSSAVMPTVGRRPETKLFDDLLRPASAESETPADATPATPLPPEAPKQDAGELIVLPPEPVVTENAPLNSESPHPAFPTVTSALSPTGSEGTAADAPSVDEKPVEQSAVKTAEEAPYSARVIESPAPPPPSNGFDDGMEATMIGIPKLIDPAAASSAAQVMPALPLDPLAADAATEKAGGEEVIPPAVPEWGDPTEPLPPLPTTQEPTVVESLPPQKGSWAPMVAALLMFVATMGVLWQKGYLDQWFGSKRVAVAPPTTQINPVETGTPPVPPVPNSTTQTEPGKQEPAKADPLTKDPNEPAKIPAKAPDDVAKQTEDELKKAAEIRMRAEAEARKLSEEIRKNEEAEARRKQEEFEKERKALAEEKERKRKEDEAKVAAARVEQEAKDAEERKKRAAQAAADLPKEVLLDLGEKVTLPFVLVPGGTFKMGTSKESAQDLAKAAGIDAKEYLMEAPPRSVKVEPFYISKTPVSVGQFRRFAEMTGYKTAAERVGEAFVLQDKQWKRVKGASWRNPGFKQSDDHPAVLLSYRDCEALLAWASRLSPQAMRLPTEAEWEYAARGTESKLYPWGNEWDGKRANFGDKQLSAMVGDANGAVLDDGNAFTSPTGAYDNASWCGALDMAGNVLQWCSDMYEEYPQSNAPQLQVDAEDVPPDAKRVLRGGSFLVGPADLRSAARRSSNPRAASVEFGVRLAFTPKH